MSGRWRAGRQVGAGTQRCWACRWGCWATGVSPSVPRPTPAELEGLRGGGTGRVGKQVWRPVLALLCTSVRPRVSRWPHRASAATFASQHPFVCQALESGREPHRCALSRLAISGRQGCKLVCHILSSPLTCDKYFRGKFRDSNPGRGHLVRVA